MPPLRKSLVLIEGIDADHEISHVVPFDQVAVFVE
jgi:hypothetical protein